MEALQVGSLSPVYAVQPSQISSAPGVYTQQVSDIISTIMPLMMLMMVMMMLVPMMKSMGTAFKS